MGVRGFSDAGIEVRKTFGEKECIGPKAKEADLWTKRR